MRSIVFSVLVSLSLAGCATRPQAPAPCVQVADNDSLVVISKACYSNFTTSISADDTNYLLKLNRVK